MKCILLLFLMCGGLFKDNSSEKKARVHICVFDKQKNPVYTATVFLSRVEKQKLTTGIVSQTDKDGECVIWVEPGCYNVRVQKVGYYPVDKDSVVMGEGQNVSIDIPMKVTVGVLYKKN